MSNLKIAKTNQKYNGKSFGSYYVRKLKNGWTVYHQSFINNKKIDTMVEKIAYPELGFRPEWTLEEARSRCKTLNKEKSLAQSKAREAASRITELQSTNSILFPVDRLQAFSKKLENDNQGSDNHLKKMNSHFLKVQKLCSDLKILPKDYKDNEKLIYKWFAKNKVSLDYTQKLIALLNRWGTFSSKADGQYFEPISPVKGISREKIRDAHEGKAGVRTESEPITPELLLLHKSKLSDENYKFLFVLTWFGLRPKELADLSKLEIKTNDEKMKFLVVYQSKLVSIEKSKRFKAIPVLFKEQETALEFIKEGKLKAPIYKKMRAVFGENYGLYGGRKGFTDLMLTKGYGLEDISLWLGHTSIETTWAHYKQKNVLKLNSPKKKT